MNISVVCATLTEYHLLDKLFNEKYPVSHSFDKRFYVNHNRVKIIRSGVGKVDAAMCATKLAFDDWTDLILNTGFASSINEKVEIFDAVIGTSYVYTDVYCGLDYTYGQVQGYPVTLNTQNNIIDAVKKIVERENAKSHFGLMTCGDKFLDNTDEVTETLRTFNNPLSYDMESTAFAQVCMHSNKQFIAVKIISDEIWKGYGRETYQHNIDNVPYDKFSIIRSLCEQL